MRTVRIIVAGGTIAGLSFALGMAGHGVVAASLIFLAMFLVPVTVGVAIATGRDEWSQRGDRLVPLMLRARPSRNAHLHPFSPTCATCRKKMHRRGNVWVCQRCDHIPAR